MRKAIHELANLFTEHLTHEDDSDITAVLNTRDMLELFKELDLTGYDAYSIRYDGELHFVSSVTGAEKELYIEDVIGSNGNVIFDDSDILILPEYISGDIREALKNNAYEKMVELTEDSTYDSLLADIERN